MRLKPLARTLQLIFADSTRPTRFIMMWGYLLCSIAFVYLGFPYNKGDKNPGGLGVLFNVASPWIWVCVSGVMTGSRFTSLFTDIQPTNATRIATPLTGIFFWSFVFSSFMVSEPPRTMGVLTIVLAFIEVWILARAITAEDLGSA